MWHAIVKSPGLRAGDIDGGVLERLGALEELHGLAHAGVGAAAKLDSRAQCVALSGATDEAEQDAALPRLSGVAEVDVELSHESQSSAVSRLNVIMGVWHAICQPPASYAGGGFFESC